MNRKLLFPLIISLLTTFLVNAQAPIANFTANVTSGCPPLVVNFTDLSTNNPTSWSWNFGGIPPAVIPGTSASKNPVVIFYTPGTYTVKMTATNASGSSVATPITITVNPTPVADFSTIDTLGCAPLHVQFTDNSAPAASITSRSWFFGDGGVSSATNPSHIFTLPGNYAVNLQVTNSFGCQGSASLKTKTGFIMVTPGVIPNFSDSLSSSCKPPTTAYFDNQTSGPGTISYTWRFGDGGTSILTNPNHTYTASGSYNVTLIAQSSQGCIDSVTNPTIISTGSVVSSFAVADSVCVGTPVIFQNTSSPTPNNSLWNFGDATTSTQQNPIHTYAIAGNYTVTLNNNFASCSDSTNKVIHVLNPPVVNFTGTNLASCKAPLTASFQDLSTNAASWSWDFGDGGTSTLKNPSYTFTAPGQYNITLTATNAAGCSSSITKSQFVQVVAPLVKITNLPAYGCSPLSYTPTVAYTVVDGIAAYFWDFGNGNTYNVANPPTQVYGPGKYVVKLTITTNGGCTASYTDTVKVGTVKPTPAFSATPLTACIGQNVQFTDASTGGANQWLWDFGDGNTSTAQNPSYSYLKPGIFSVTLTAYNNGCFDFLTKVNYITVKPPLSKFGYSFNCTNKNQYTFTDSSIGAITWDWDFGDGSPHYTSGANPPPHVYPGVSATYTVSLTVTNAGCSNTSSQTIKVLQKNDFTFSANPICVNTIFNTNPIIADPNAYAAIYYDFGDGSPIVGPTRNGSYPHLYSVAGPYTVKVTITDTSGCLDSTTHIIQINGPTAKFTAPVTLSCGSYTASFTDQSTSTAVPITSWFWDFGDGSTSVQKNPTHTYTTQGTYPVKLKVTDASGCSDSLVKSNFIIVSIPVAKFTTIDSLFCPSSLIKFTNASIGGFTPVYTWDFGNGTYTGTNPPLHNYPAVGKYTVSLKITDMYNCISIYTKNNYINIDTPVAAFTIDDSVAPCPPLLVHFTFAGSYYKSVLWNFGPNEGVSDSLNTQHLYGIPGTYFPSLTVTSPGGCIAQTSKKVQVFGPYGQFTYSPLGGCDTLTVNFNVVTNGVVGYIWYFGNNDSIQNTVPFISYKYTQPGTYLPVLKLIDSTSCNVAIPGPSPIIIDSLKAKFGSDKNVLCSSGSISFTDSSFKMTGTLITNYFWDFGDGNTISGMFTNPSHFYSTPGAYTVKMVVTTQFGCQDSTTRLIKVVANPSIGINGVVSQCAPATLNFSGIILVPDTSAFTWFWDFDNGQTSTLQNPAAQIYSKAGHYVVKLTATNSSNCSTIDSSDLFIYPIPNISAGIDTTICLGQSITLQASGGTSYTWLPPSNTGLSCTNCSNPVASPTITTSYFVTGTSPNGCQATDTIVVKVNLPVTVTVNPSADSVCIGQNAQLSASGTDVYIWTPVAGLSNPNIANPIARPSTTTTYQVIGSDNKYCFSDTQYVQITVFNYPTINVGPDVTIPVGSSYQINGSGSSDIVSINWFPTTGLSCTNCLSPLATPKNTTTYIATVINNGTCVTSDSLKITVICDNNNFFVPNTFSPNGDGMNDVFFVRGKGLNIIPSMIIYNRWGQIVFEKRDFAPNDPSAGWDGNVNGKKAPIDVYVYTIEVICDNSTLIPYHGNITLIR